MVGDQYTTNIDAKNVMNNDSWNAKNKNESYLLNNVERRQLLERPCIPEKDNR